MKQETKEIVYALLVTVVIAYYCIRLFSFLYLVPQSITTMDIKSRPAIEQPHLKSELKRHVRHESKTSDTSIH